MGAQATGNLSGEALSWEVWVDYSSHRALMASGPQIPHSAGSPSLTPGSAASELTEAREGRVWGEHSPYTKPLVSRAPFSPSGPSSPSCSASSSNSALVMLSSRGLLGGYWKSWPSCFISASSLAQQLGVLVS